MKERGLIFTGESVRAILAGTKTQTRRIIKPQPERRSDAWYWTSPRYDNGDGVRYFHTQSLDGVMSAWERACPHGVPGDRLWAKATWRTHENAAYSDGVVFAADESFQQIADTDEACDAWLAAHKAKSAKTASGWRSSMFMPRWASRVDLEIVEIRVERLLDISEDDARAEGMTEPYGGEFFGFTGRPWAHAYLVTWAKLHGRESVDANPFTWAITFKRTRP